MLWRETVSYITKHMDTINIPIYSALKIIILTASHSIRGKNKRQFHKMVKHTQATRRQFADELFEYV